MRKIIFCLFFILILFAWSQVSAFHDGIYGPRVPAQLMEELQDMDNPFPATPDRIELGKKIYNGKGLCATCHSKTGKGIKLPGHPPRDFTNEKWQEIRTDGEIMWVLRNGSPGTEMPV